MKKLLIIAVICLALSGNTTAMALALILAIWVPLFWVLKKIGILSAPRRMSNAAGNEVRRAYNRKVIRDEIRRSFWR